MTEPTADDLARDLAADLVMLERYRAFKPQSPEQFRERSDAWVILLFSALPAAIRRALAADARAEVFEANLLAITEVCALAGIGSRGQSVLCRVKDLHAEFGRALAENARLRKACDIFEKNSAGAAQLFEANRKLEDENARLRTLCRSPEAARDERDAYLADLREIGRMIGCDHVHDGHARCVRDTIEGLQRQIDGHVARIAAQSDQLSKLAEREPLCRLCKDRGWIERPVICGPHTSEAEMRRLADEAGGPIRCPSCKGD